ncbi:MAG: hypothetical protein ABIF08_02930 [Nanoarchaeota archaeon]
MTSKAITFWIIGALLIFAGSWIIGNLELTVGVDVGIYTIMAVVSFLFILMGGICWIYVSKRDIK